MCHKPRFKYWIMKIAEFVNALAHPCLWAAPLARPWWRASPTCMCLTCLERYPCWAPLCQAFDVAHPCLWAALLARPCWRGSSSWVSLTCLEWHPCRATPCQAFSLAQPQPWIKRDVKPTNLVSVAFQADTYRVHVMHSWLIRQYLGCSCGWVASPSGTSFSMVSGRGGRTQHHTAWSLEHWWSTRSLLWRDTSHIKDMAEVHKWQWSSISFNNPAVFSLNT